MPNFKAENEGRWFYFDPSKKELGGVKLRELSPEEFDRIDKITVKHRKKVIRGTLVDDTKEDEKTASRMRWDYCIQGWAQVTLDGQPMECDADSKVRMMGCLDFAKFVVDSLAELVETNKAIEEARLKNSESSSNGSEQSLAAVSVVSSTTKA